MPRTNDAELHITQIRDRISKLIEKQKSSGSLSWFQSVSLSGLYDQVNKSLDDLTRSVSGVYKKDGEGNEKEINSAEMQKLRDQYLFAFNSLRKLYSEGKLQDDGKKLVQSAAEEIGTELNILLWTKNAAKYNVPEIFRNSGEKVLQLSNEEYDSVGGNQSSRIPVRYRDGSGEIVNGFFTPEKKIDVSADFEKLAFRIEKIMERPEFANSLRNFWDKYKKAKRAEYIDRIKSKVKSEEEREKLADRYSENAMGILFNELFSFDIKKIPKDIIDPQHPLSDEESAAFAKYFNSIKSVDSYGFRLEVLYKKYADNSHILGGSRKLSDGSIYFSNFSTEINKAFIQNNFYIDTLGSKNGRNVDKRGTAMSEVAKLLGVPDLICHSENMTLIIDGKAVNGTFIQDAEGIDPNRLPADFVGNGVRQNNSSSLASVFDLQVLDYICGNVDRHGGNIFYQYDDNGKLKGIQGIDNDCAFGTNTFSQFYSVMNLACPERMNYITPNMKAALARVTPEALRVALSGKELDPSEIEAAVSRLEYLKKSVKTLKVFDRSCELYNTPLSNVTLSEKYFPQGAPENTTLSRFLDDSKYFEKGKRHHEKGKIEKNSASLTKFDNDLSNDDRLSQLNDIEGRIEEIIEQNEADLPEDAALTAFVNSLKDLGISALDVQKNGLRMTTASAMRLQYSKARSAISKIRNDHAAAKKEYPEDLIKVLADADKVFEAQSKFISDAIPEINNSVADSVRKNVSDLKKANKEIDELKKTGLIDSSFKSIEDLLYAKDENGEQMHEIQRDSDGMPIYKYGMKKITAKEIKKERGLGNDIVEKDGQIYAKVYLTKTVGGQKVRIPKPILENGKPVPLFNDFTKEADRRGLGAFISEMPKVLNGIESKDDPRLSYGMVLLRDALKAASKKNIGAAELFIDKKTLEIAKSSVERARDLVNSVKPQNEKIVPERNKSKAENKEAEKELFRLGRIESVN